MKTEVIKKIVSCRVCKNNNFTKVLTLGPTPLANAFLSKNEIDKEEYFYPLDVYFCNVCSFLTLGHVVSPEVLFSNYVYVSSTSQVFIDHFRKFADEVFNRFGLNKHALVIDIGSNDGILLKPFKALGARVLGIEPAKKIALVARKDGVDTISEFFSVELSKKIVKKYGVAKIITATNVFAHIDDLDEIIRGLDVLLDKDGVFIMEAPYLIDFLEKRYFDLVYHEHLSYWAVMPLITLFKRFNFEVFDAQKVAAHGGTVRVFVQRKKGKHKKERSIEKFLRLEKRVNLNKSQTYMEFAKEVIDNKNKLLKLLTQLKFRNKKIAGYGAPAKGNTLLNYFGIGTEFLEYIVDDSPWKQGLFTPGKRIPVLSSEEMYKQRVDYLLILAWNFADSIMQIHKKFKRLGGRFIVPVPAPKII